MIHLWPHECDCWICDTGVYVNPQGPSYGVPIFEGYIVPDDYLGEWGGVTVCMACFCLTLHLQEQHPGKAIPHGLVRRLRAAA